MLFSAYNVLGIETSPIQCNGPSTHNNKAKKVLDIFATLYKNENPKCGEKNKGVSTLYNCTIAYSWAWEQCHLLISTQDGTFGRYIFIVHLQILGEEGTKIVRKRNTRNICTFTHLRSPIAIQLHGEYHSSKVI